MNLTQKLLFTCCGLLLFNCFFIYHFYEDFKSAIAFMLPGYTKLSISIQCNEGRLGNQMCSYATLYGLSVLNNRRPLPLNCNNKHLRNIFVGPNESMSVNEYYYPHLHPWKIWPYLKPEDAAIPENSNFIEGYAFPCSYTFFDHARDKIRREFQFQDYLNAHAQQVLHEANVHNLQNVTYVAIHVRRGDYQKRWLEAFEAAPVNEEYFEEAVKYFKDKYSNIIFVAISEDREWCRKNLSAFGVYVPKDPPSAAHDLAVIANCNHTIMTYGTYGFWGSYLAGGEVLYFDKFLKPNTSFALEYFLFDKMYPPDWKGIVTINSSYWLEKIEIKNETVHD